MNFKTISVTIIILLISIFSTVYLINIDYKRTKQKINLIKSLQDSLQIYKNKDNNEVAKIGTINSSTKDFIDLKIKDKEIQELQKLVKEYKNKLKNQGSVTKFSNNTKVETKTITKIEYDTIIKNNIQEIYPKYKSNFNLNNWVVGDIIASKDSTNINLGVKNKYAVIIGEESQGWFKPKKTFVEVINYNPYSSTEKLRTYQVEKPKNKLFSIGPYIGVGINQERKFIPSVGIGLQYNILKF